MKRRQKIIIGFLTAVIVVMLAAVVVLGIAVMDALKERDVVPSSVQETQTAFMTKQETVVETIAQEEEMQSAEAIHVKTVEQTVAETKEPLKKQIIVLGDSRTVGLYCSAVYEKPEYLSHIFYHISENYTGVNENVLFIAKGGEGCSWFGAVGVPLMEKYLDENSVIVVWFGVNDLTESARYINLVNTKLLSYGVPVYYMTVGPCYDKWASKNQAVVAFNQALVTGLSPQVNILDTYQMIADGVTMGEYHTIDGLHYDYETSKAVVRYMTDIINLIEMGQ